MYKRKHIVIDLDKSFEGKCTEKCEKHPVLHFHTQKGEKESIIFYPACKEHVEKIIELKKSFYPNAEMIVSDGINNYQFVPEYNTDNYKYYYGEGINTAVNDPRVHYYRTLDGNTFMYNIDRNTLNGPITDIVSEAAEKLFRNEELSKNQATIQIKQHPEIDNRPEQNVHNIDFRESTRRIAQKKKKDLSEYPGDKSFLKRRLGVAVANERGHNSPDISDKISGSRLYDSHKKNPNDEGGTFNTKDSFSFVNDRSNNKVVTHHEANHKLGVQLANKFGENKVNKFYDTLLSHIKPETRKKLDKMLTNYLDYDKIDPNSLHYKEEMINLVRDLTQKGNRRNYFIGDLKGVNPSSGHPKMTLDNDLKSAWKNIVNTAKQYSFGKNMSEELDLLKNQAFIQLKQHPEIDSRPDQNVSLMSMRRDIQSRLNNKNKDLDNASLESKDQQQSVSSRKPTQAESFIHRKFQEGEAKGRNAKKIVRTDKAQGTKEYNKLKEGSLGGAYLPSNDFAIANDTEPNNVNVYHEANHKLGEQLASRFGENKVNKFYDTLLSHIDDTTKDFLNGVLKEYGYKIPDKNAKPWQKRAYKEEMINLVRDLTQKGPTRRDNGLGNIKFDKEKMGDIDNLDNIMRVRRDRALKQAWRNMVNTAKNYRFDNGKKITKGEMSRLVGSSLLAGGLALGTNMPNSFSGNTGNSIENQNKAPIKREIKEQNPVKIKRVSGENQNFSEPQPSNQINIKRVGPPKADKEKFLNALQQVYQQKYGGAVQINPEIASKQFDKYNTLFRGNPYRIAHAFQHGYLDTVDKVANQIPTREDKFVQNFNKYYSGLNKK